MVLCMSHSITTRQLFYLHVHDWRMHLLWLAGISSCMRGDK